VFDELIDVIGNEALIPDLSQIPQSTTNPVVANATENAALFLLTPGAELTATAGVREIVGPVAAVNADGSITESQDTSTQEIQLTVLPTFTYPASIAMVATETIPEDTPPQPRQPDTEGVPPILPIVLLGGFGMLGLAVSALRR
jgi:hypothetical protein